jgi:choline-sulfatase
VRQGRYKYVSVHTAGPLLFDLEQDPNEWHNLAGQPEVAEVEAQLRQRVEADWDGAAIEAAELHAQQERLFVRKALQQGKQKAWDFQPETDAGNQYTR